MGTDGDEQRPGPPSTGPEASALDVLDRHRRELHALPRVVGAAVGRAPTGEDCIVVYLRDSSAASAVPPSIEGVPVQTIVTGEIDAL